MQRIVGDGRNGRLFFFPLRINTRQCFFSEEELWVRKKPSASHFFFQSAEAIGKKCREISSKLFSTVS